MALGLYIHIPFCVRKCKYCDFISFEQGDKDAYIDALIDEIRSVPSSGYDSIFIGGGTPSSLSAKQMERLLSFINKTLEITNDCEWSMEANPNTLDEEKLRVMKEYGVNRLSVGVQSFCDSELAAIGRLHTAKEAIDTVQAARRAGFDNINIDIMSALPEQSMQSFEKTLDTAIALAPEHISCYSLIIEPGTALCEQFEHGTLVLPDEDCERAMYEAAQDKLTGAGYNQYEISNFSKPGRQCRHNLKYWNCEEYIGAGLAAHSYYNGFRYCNTQDMSEYLSGNFEKERNALTKDDKKAEFIIMALRLSRGVDEKEYKRRFGTDFYAEYKDITDKFLKLGLMERTEHGFRLSVRGISVSNSVMCEYV